MAKKLEHHAIEDEVNSFIHTIDRADLKPFIEKLKQFIRHTEAIPSIQLQVDDILKNINEIKAQPFISIQLQRLCDAEKLSSDVQKHEAQFKEILADYHIQMSVASKLSLDPHFKTDLYNSAVAKYQQWLLDLLFLLYCFNFSQSVFNTYLIESYLIFMHEIYTASVTTKISLRDQASVNGTVLIEIPRNSLVHVYGNIINDYWLKISIHINDLEIEGYVQAIYLKKK